MKNLILCIALFYLGSLWIYAQNYKDENDLITGSLSTNAQLNIVSLPNDSKTSIVQTIPLNNAVFIDQVGFGNRVGAVIVSNNSSVNILQDGGNNFVDLKLKSAVIKENILQQGFNNQIYDYSLHGSLLHDVSVKQIGNYNTTISVGSNSISEKLKVNQTSVGSSIYVIHF